jgi:hypothetical protein
MMAAVEEQSGEWSVHQRRRSRYHAGVLARERRNSPSRIPRPAVTRLSSPRGSGRTVLPHHRPRRGRCRTSLLARAGVVEDCHHRRRNPAPGTRGSMQPRHIRHSRPADRDRLGRARARYSQTRGDLSTDRQRHVSGRADSRTNWHSLGSGRPLCRTTKSPASIRDSISHEISTG